MAARWAALLQAVNFYTNLLDDWSNRSFPIPRAAYARCDIQRSGKE